MCNDNEAAPIASPSRPEVQNFATIIDIRGGHSVRIDRVRATLDAQGWEV